MAPSGPGDNERMDTPQSPVLNALERFHATREEVEHFVVTYRSAIDEIETKVRVLRREFTSVHDYNPIEHVSSLPRASTVCTARRSLAV